jgi:Fe2+ or Zn2+ uptake regulation protein
MTKQRSLIYEILQSNGGHLTADDIFMVAKQRMPNIARGTVYRNLKLMERDKEIARLEMPDGPDRYDKTSVPHGHLYCDACGSITDVPVVGLIRELETSLGTDIHSYQLTIHYYCPECRKKLSH